MGVLESSSQPKEEGITAGEALIVSDKMPKVKNIILTHTVCARSMGSLARDLMMMGTGSRKM